MNGRLLDKENNDIFMDPVTHSVRRASTIAERVGREIGTILRTFEGECFTDYDAGVPWYDDILGQSVLFADEMNAEIKDKIMEIDGVESVEAVRVKVSGRNLSGKYRVTISDGTQLSGNL